MSCERKIFDVNLLSIVRQVIFLCKYQQKNSKVYQQWFHRLPYGAQSYFRTIVVYHNPMAPVPHLSNRYYFSEYSIS